MVFSHRAKKGSFFAVFSLSPVVHSWLCAFKRSKTDKNMPIFDFNRKSRACANIAVSPIFVTGV